MTKLTRDDVFHIARFGVTPDKWPTREERTEVEKTLASELLNAGATLQRVSVVALSEAPIFEAGLKAVSEEEK